jgi:translation initiation factor 1
MGKKTPPPPTEQARPFHNPFGALGSLRESLPSAPAEAPRPEPVRKGPARAVVRLEKKGRGGKEVTVVEKLELAAGELEAWLKALKNSLGCGGTVEGESLVFQGDQRERLPALLEARGVRRVTVG